MPDTVARFTVSVPPELLSTFDEVCAAKGYVSRSEAVRDAIRDYLVQHDWTGGSPDAEAVGTITILYDSDHPRPTHSVLERPVDEGIVILSVLQVPLSGPLSVETVVARGPAEALARLADALISLRGVKHGRLTAVSLATALP